MKRFSRLFCLSVCAWIVFPASAHAHLVNTGFGSFYNGLCHPFVNVTDLMLVLSLSLLAGFSGPATGRNVLFSLTFAWTAGAMIGRTCIDSTWTLPTVVAVGIVFYVAAMATANFRCSTFFIRTLGAITGFSFGLSNGVEFTTLSKGSLALSGVVVAIFVVTSGMTGFAVKNGYGWRLIVLRVASSWITATCILMIGWELRAKLVN